MLEIGDKSLSEFDDDELLEWMNGVIISNGGRSIQSRVAHWYLGIMRVFDSDGTPMTVRQVFYALESRYGLEKSQNAYDRVGSYLLRMRRMGVIPYSFVADSTRWMRKPRSFNSVAEALEYTKKTYRRALWSNSPDYLEIWCEKDALAGILFEITQEWDIPLMVTRGFPSETYVYDAAEQIKEASRDRDPYVYYFGDLDKAGKDIAASTLRKLAGFGAVFEFEWAAITAEQVKQYDLPTKPEASGWKIELDALPAPVLRELCKACIERHVDQDEFERLRLIEKAEREAFESYIRLARNKGESHE